MIEIATILRPESVIPSLASGSQKAALEEMSAVAASATGLDQRRIFDVLLERERLGSTGVGNGIAIPHGKLAELDRVHMVFARAKDGIDFDAVDDEPVDLFCLLLAPEEAGADHLKALARVSRLLRDATFCAKLRGAAGADALYALLAQSESEKAA